MLTTMSIFGLLSMFGLILGAEAPAADAAQTVADDDDQDEQELIASIGDGVAPAITAGEDKDDDDQEPATTERPASEPEKPEDDKPAPPATEATPPVAAAGGGSDDAEPVSKGVQPDPAVAGDSAKPVKPSVTAQPSQAAQRLAELEATILKEDFDPYSVDGRKLQLEHNRLAAQVAAEPIATNQFWIGESVTHGLARQTMQDTWDGIQAQYRKDYPGVAAEYWQIAATKDYQAAITALKAQRQPVTSKTSEPAKPPKATAPTPITPKGARVAPPAAVVPPPPKAKSDEEELIDSVRREVKSGVRV